MYERICIENNTDFVIYYGAGKYVTAKQNALLHYDDDLSISYMLHCSGNIKIEGKCFAIQSGDVVITTPCEIHCCEIEDGTYYERISVCIKKSVLNNFHFESEELLAFFEQQKKFGSNIIPSEIVSDHKLDELINEIFGLAKKPSGKNRILSVCKIIELLTRLGNAISCQGLKPSSSTEENPTISKVIKYIDDSFTQKINCEEIAQRFFLNKYYLEHIFKERVGTSLWEYVILKRLLYVNELLQQKYPLEEASRTAGFSNYANFYRLYKKHFNMTPADYKRSIKV